MDLRNQILKEHSKTNCQKIIDWVGNDTSRFNQLFHLFLNDDTRVTQRAAWPMCYCAIAYPGLMDDNFEKLFENLNKKGIHNVIKRNSVRLLQHITIPSQHEGTVMNLCFQYVESPNEAVAIKAFSLTILGKLAKKYPEIIPEIKMLIESQTAHQTPAFKNRASKLFREFGIH